MIMRLLHQIRVYRGILDHPLNGGCRASATKRWLLWHLSSRLAPGPIAVPFVNSTALLVSPGMTGATTNVYCGLADPADMGFVLHALRPSDVFLDIGANVGAYTVLASGAAGARTIAVEALPETFAALTRNIALNDLSGLVRGLNVAVGDRSGTARFSSGHGAMNHVLAHGDTAASCEVSLVTLDEALAGQDVTVLKMDIEGYELPALRGARTLLRSETLKAVVIELNGSGARYGFDDRDTVELLSRNGFVPVEYDPFRRVLTGHDGAGRGGEGRGGNNRIFVRDPAAMQALLRDAPAYRIGNGRIL
jgi:FkbM family methyltransferase